MPRSRIPAGGRDRRFIDPDLIAQAFAMVAEGASIAAASRATGINDRTIRRAIPRDQWPGHPARRIDPAKLAAARELLAEGAPLTATAETLGIAPNTLRKHGLVGISHQEAGSLGRAVRIHNQKVSRV